MSVIRELLNKYPAVNRDWEYKSVSVDNSLESYLHRIYFYDGYVGVANNHHTVRDFFVRNNGIDDFFMRESDVDDFYDNPAIFTDNVNALFDYKGNRDPWGRRFKVYKSWNNDVTNGEYLCKAILANNGKPVAYLLSTSVEGHTIYCVDRIGYGY